MSRARDFLKKFNEDAAIVLAALKKERFKVQQKGDKYTAEVPDKRSDEFANILKKHNIKFESEWELNKKGHYTFIWNMEP